jgi:septum formation protein
MPERLVLASASTARAALLRAAGVDFDIKPAAIDEANFKQDVRAKGWTAVEAARGLAIAKTILVSDSSPGDLVIGADQLLAADDEWFDKPRDLAEARAQLLRLRGRTHVLATAVCVAQDGDPVWQTISAPELTMREFQRRLSRGVYCRRG